MAAAAFVATPLVALVVQPTAEIPPLFPSATEGKLLQLTAERHAFILRCSAIGSPWRLCRIKGLIDKAVIVEAETSPKSSLGTIEVLAFVLLGNSPFESRSHLRRNEQDSKHHGVIHVPTNSA